MERESFLLGLEIELTTKPMKNSTKANSLESPLISEVNQNMKNKDNKYMVMVFVFASLAILATITMAVCFHIMR